MSNPSMPDSPEGIAIIGMSGRFPGARNLDEFWRNLCEGVESITCFRNEELVTSIISPVDPDTPNFIKAAPILDDVESFDAAFFGLTPRDAEVMDPQQRLYLECAWEALEHAGYDSDTYKGWVGVFGGVGLPGYLLNNLYRNDEIRAAMASGSLQISTGNNVDYLATRVAYKLNLKGPSITLQTACSTSLVAVHLACQSLLNYQCDMALAGGISIRIPQKDGYWYQEGGIMSPDGHCRAFDARAGGTVFGSGVGIVVLKRLAEAIANGDHIYAVIKGSAINNDGSLKVGFTAPGIDGQATVIAMAQGAAGVDPETISYIEAHGTATPVGDPIEIAALTRVFRARTQKKRFCAIGSVKTNIGHANTAAGIAGLIKTVLALNHKMIPPSLHFEQPNPKIDFEHSPFYVNTALAPWEAGPTPRRAGVSSFGVGGSNAHVVVEEAPAAEPSGPALPWQLLVLSAKTDSALETATTNLLEYLKQHSDLNLADAAYTLQVGRRVFNHRRMLVCCDLDDAVRALELRDPKRVFTRSQEQRERPVVFMFSGQGAQYINMARDLYELMPVFREQVDRCAELLRPHLGLDLRGVLYPEEPRTTQRVPDREPEHKEQRTKNKEQTIDGPRTTDHGPRTTDHGLLNQTWITQPALFVIEYALAQLWIAWGIRPQAMIGHSIGEYVAACLAGVFSLEDALALVAARGRLMQQMPAGAMLAVPLPEPEVEPLLGDQLSLAAINGPSRCVVSGPIAAVEALEHELAERGVEGRRLHTSHAFHSMMIDPILDLFMKEVATVQLNAPSIPYLSNVTGTWITTEEATAPTYWAQHLRRMVRFADGVRELLQEPAQILLEVGPGQTLSTLARQYPSGVARPLVLASLRHPHDQQSDVAFLLNTLGQLWQAGLRIDWPNMHAHERRQRIPLTTYPFERQRYWIEPSENAASARPRPGALNKKPDIADWFYIPSWKRSIPPAREPDALTGQTACWLVFSDGCGLGARLVKRLGQACPDVVTVTAGQQFSKHAAHMYTIDPRQPNDYVTLLRDLHVSNKTPQVIVHLWSITSSDQPIPGATRREQSQDLGFYSLLFLAQALGEQKLTDPVRIEVVSNNMQHVASEAVLCPEKATLLGPCKVIPQEYPNITCRSIDVVLPVPGTIAAEELVDQLIAEIAAPAADQVIAYRDYDRWVQTYEAVHLGKAIESNTRLREGGVYLITGGLGGIGLVLAEYLARTVRAKLVLIGRSAFPDRAAWEQWLATHDDQDRVSKNIRTLQELEQLGAEALVINADVTNEADMHAAVAQAREQFGTIHGVIHAAGVAGGGLIQLKTAEVAARVLAPKLNAIWSLEMALADVQIDFLLLCSSTIAIVGGMGQVDYCAANAFLDAYAHYSNSQRNIFTISVNWDAWQEVGMAVNARAAYGLVGAGSAPRVKELAHPLLDACIRETANQAIYLTTFSVTSHWVLAEHKIFGVSVLPGTTYLEMVRAAFEDRARNGPVELRDVFFLTPLMVGTQTQAEVHTILEGAGDVVEFRVVSRSASKNGAEPSWQEHARGKIGQLSGEPPKQYDIARLIEPWAAQEIRITMTDAEAAEAFVYWGPRWRSLKQAHSGTNEGIAVLELPAEFAMDLQEFKLHPALLDVATAFASGMAGDGGNYLPLSYKRVKIHGPLPQTIYSYMRYTGTPSTTKETISFDITILDEQGQELIAIEEFTLKRVHESTTKLSEGTAWGHRHESRSAPLGEVPLLEQGSHNPDSLHSAAGSAMTLGAGILSAEGVEAFNRILSRRRLPQIVVSTKDLHAVIERATLLTQARILEEIDDAQRSKPTHPRPDVQTPYVAPRNVIEQHLADMWQRVIGIEQVGVHDNFFELGGDSVLAIQIIARASDAGLQLTPAQLFQSQTIAELATLVSSDTAVQADHSPVAGPTPLIPFQHWWFESGPSEPQRWGQMRLLELQHALDPVLLEQAVEHILGRHDALRLRFRRDGSSWQPVIADMERRPVFSVVDLAALPDARRGSAIEAIASEMQADLNLAEGPLMRAAFLDCGAGTPGQLLLMIHDLVADPVSWRIVLEDLWTAYGQLSHGEAIQLPPRNASFKLWAERLIEYAQSEAARGELGYWLAESRMQIARLPLDKVVGEQADIAGPTSTVSVALGTDETRILLQDVCAARHTQIHEALLTALALALAPWVGTGPVLVDLERDGRAGNFDDLDLSRTVGCFTSVFPMLLDLGRVSDPGNALKTLKEQLRGVPNYGIGYGILRYLTGDMGITERLRTLPQAEVHFMYLGQHDQAVPATAPFRLVRAHTGPRQHSRSHRYMLEVSGSIAEDQLHVEWTYNARIHQHTTIERLAQAVLAALRALIDHCQSSELGGYTPSDFPEAGLSQADLDQFLISIRRRSNIEA